MKITPFAPLVLLLFVYVGFAARIGYEMRKDRPAPGSRHTTGTPVYIYSPSK